MSHCRTRLPCRQIWYCVYNRSKQMLTQAETRKAKFETEFGKPWRSKHLDIAVRKVTFCEHLLQCQTSKSRIRLAQESLIKDKKIEGDATVTRMNSWPTAPETPAIATLGPFESFAARMMREARVGRRLYWQRVKMVPGKCVSRKASAHSAQASNAQHTFVKVLEENGVRLATRARVSNRIMPRWAERH